MDKELLEQFQMIAQGMGRMEERLSEEMGRMEERLGEEMGQIKQYVDERVARVEVLIETAVTKRIDSLFDGYKLAHEKQWELERQTEIMQNQIQDLQTRLLAIENKIA